VGDEYVGLEWRDTHVRLRGPAVLELQLSFLEDWRWASGELLDLEWEPQAAPGGKAEVLVLPTGPADVLETCSLMYQQAIHAARERVWMATPYFVPDESVLSALHLAALRGIEVKILIPEMPDNKLVYYSAYSFLAPLLEEGVEVYRYQPGFLHEKVILVDDRLAGVGTANMDNRSFRLNFEVTALVHHPDFARQMAEMFRADFARSRKMSVEDVTGKSTWFRLLSRAAYLTAPIQ
jgi:cardiolipin synthase